METNVDGLDASSWSSSALRWAGPLAVAVNAFRAPVGFAQARPTDLLVVGTQSLGGFPGLRIGGAPLKVLHRSAMMIGLVPRSR